MKVRFSVVNGKVIIEPVTRPSYTLAELIAACDLLVPVSPEEQE